MRTYKKQIEEAEEIAAMNLAKFRKTQVDMQESLERADINEQALARFRARGRNIRFNELSLNDAILYCFQYLSIQDFSESL